MLLVLYGMQEVLPHFRERGEGHVINVSSILGRIPYTVFRSAYVGAKHFLSALTAMARAEARTSAAGECSISAAAHIDTLVGMFARAGIRLDVRTTVLAK